MTTKEAFGQLISKRGWYKELGINAGTANSWANYYRKGSYLSNEKMEEILKKAGYKVMSEKQWSGPAGQFTSKIDCLMDMPVEYFDTFPVWQKMMSHLLPADMPYIDQVKAFDIYMQKLKLIK